MNSKQILVVGSLIGALIAALPAAAHDPGSRRRERAELHLTEAQRASMRTIRERTRSELRPLRETMARKAVEYRRLRAAGNSTDALRNEIRSLREEISILRQAARVEARAVLTDEQRRQMQQRREERRRAR